MLRILLPILLCMPAIASAQVIGSGSTAYYLAFTSSGLQTTFKNSVWAQIQACQTAFGPSDYVRQQVYDCMPAEAVVTRMEGGTIPSYKQAYSSSSVYGAALFAVSYDVSGGTAYPLNIRQTVLASETSISCIEQTEYTSADKLSVPVGNRLSGNSFCWNGCKATAASVFSGQYNGPFQKHNEVCPLPAGTKFLTAPSVGAGACTLGERKEFVSGVFRVVDSQFCGKGDSAFISIASTDGSGSNCVDTATRKTWFTLRDATTVWNYVETDGQALTAVFYFPDKQQINTYSNFESVECGNFTPTDPDNVTASPSSVESLASSCAQQLYFDRTAEQWVCAASDPNDETSPPIDDSPGDLPGLEPGTTPDNPGSGSDPSPDPSPDPGTGSGEGSGEGSDGAMKCGGPGQPKCGIDDSGFSGKDDFSGDLAGIDQKISDGVSGINRIGSIGAGDLGFESSWIPDYKPGARLACRPIVYEPSITSGPASGLGGRFEVDICDQLATVRQMLSWLVGIFTIFYLYRTFLRASVGLS